MIRDATGETAGNKRYGVQDADGRDSKRIRVDKE